MGDTVHVHASCIARADELVTCVDVQKYASGYIVSLIDDSSTCCPQAVM